MSERTEPPTPRRLRKAHGEGDSGASAFATQAVGFLAAVVLVPAAGTATAVRASHDLRATLQAIGVAGGIRQAFDPVYLASEIIALTGPILAGAALAAGVVHVAQTSGVIVAQRVAPRLDRLDPTTGIRALFSGDRLFAVARALVAALAVGELGYAALREHVSDLARLAGRLTPVGPAISAAASSLALRAAFVGLLLAAVDIVVVRRSRWRRLRMTKDEVRREHRDSEGDPQTKAARERAYHEMSAQATVADVKSATVVVVNPTHVACALRYDDRRGDDAPVVLAKGEGSLAARIASAAHDYGIPVVRDAPLARALVELEIGQAIPEILYESVAQILSEMAKEQGTAASRSSGDPAARR